MAAVLAISDDWEHLSDDDTFSVVSVPPSESDTVDILAVSAAFVPDKHPTSPAIAHEAEHGARDGSTESEEPAYDCQEAQEAYEAEESPETPEAHVAVELPVEASSQPGTPRETGPATRSIAHAPTNTTEDVTDSHERPREQPLSPVQPSPADTATREPKGPLAQLADYYAHDRACVQHPAALLSSVADVDAACSTAILIATEEVAPLRPDIANQMVAVSSKISIQVDRLYPVLVTYRRAWEDRGILYNEGAVISAKKAPKHTSLGPLIAGCLACATEHLQVLQDGAMAIVSHHRTASNVAESCWDNDKKTLRVGTESDDLEFQQQVEYGVLVDCSQQMDEVLPIILSDFANFQNEELRADQIDIGNPFE